MPEAFRCAKNALLSASSRGNENGKDAVFGGVDHDMIEVIIAPQERQEEVWKLFLEYADELAEFDGFHEIDGTKTFTFLDRVLRSP